MIVGMGLVTSHTYNLSHAYLSHTPHCKAPYISGLIHWSIHPMQDKLLLRPVTLYVTCNLVR